MLGKKFLNVTFYETLWYFFIYAFLGWLMEEIYIFVTFGVLVKRGFLHIPIGPIYGFGMLIVLFALTPIKKRILPLFAGSVLLTTILEYCTGYVLDHLFHQRWWDYTGFPNNLGGYVCLEFSLMWGIVGVVFIRWIHPVVRVLVAKVPYKWGRRILMAIYTIILVDSAATGAGLILQQITP